MSPPPLRGTGRMGGTLGIGVSGSSLHEIAGDAVVPTTAVDANSAVEYVAIGDQPELNGIAGQRDLGADLGVPIRPLHDIDHGNHGLGRQRVVVADAVDVGFDGLDDGTGVFEPHAAVVAMDRVFDLAGADIATDVSIDPGR